MTRDGARGGGARDWVTVAEASAADWVCEALTGFGGRVDDVVPGGFEAYVRIVHPAARDGRPVTWSEVAAANGRTAHAEMQWHRIVGGLGVREQPGVWDEEPEEGCLPQPLGRELAGVLAAHTATPDRCWFGVWDGWGRLRIGERDTASFAVPHREFLLVRGPMEAVHTSSFEPDPFGPDASESGSDEGAAFSWIIAEADGDDLGELGAEGGGGEAGDEADGDEPFFQSANIWWPEDRSWCVATEIDFTCTYVAADRRCADALLRAPGIEAYEAAPDHDVTEDGDRVNPRPRRAGSRGRGVFPGAARGLRQRISASLPRRLPR